MRFAVKLSSICCEAYARRHHGVSPWSFITDFCKKTIGDLGILRRGRESDPRIEVLQTPALPLRHRAISLKAKWSISRATAPNLNSSIGVYQNLKRNAIGVALSCPYTLILTVQKKFTEVTVWEQRQDSFPIFRKLFLKLPHSIAKRGLFKI